MSMIADIYSGYAQAANYKSQANAANYNATIAEQNAESAASAGSANEEAQRRKSAVEMGRLRAGMAENGIGLDSGTATDITEQSAMNAELDALNVRYQGQVQARDYKAQGALGRMSAQQARNNASTAVTSGYLNGAAKALTAGMQYAGK